MSRGQKGRAAYAEKFQSWVFDRLVAGEVDALTGYRTGAPDASRAHPTEEHFLPLFVALGAAGANAVPERVYDGFEGAALAMDAYRFN
jgi:4,5-DOPA dioxygenase extradiol